MKFDIFFLVLVVLPEMAMFIWGNTFIYASKMDDCKDTDKNPTAP